MNIIKKNNNQISTSNYDTKELNYMKVLNKPNIAIKNINNILFANKYYSDKNLVAVDYSKLMTKNKNVMRIVKGGNSTIKRKKFFFENTMHSDNKYNYNGGDIPNSPKTGNKGSQFRNLEKIRKEKYDKEIEMLNEKDDSDDIGRYDVNSPLRSPKRNPVNGFSRKSGFFSFLN